MDKKLIIAQIHQKEPTSNLHDFFEVYQIGNEDQQVMTITYGGY